MKNYNHEIKVLNDLQYRYVNIECHGGYGNNPSVTMMSRRSFISEGFIKDIDVKHVGKDENGENMFDRHLIIDSEYGHEIRLPYEKIIGMSILSSAEQASLEMCIRREENWKKELINYKEILNDSRADGELLKITNKMIEVTEKCLLKKDELIARGVTTYK